MNAREHALRVAVLGTLLDTVKTEYHRAREAAAEVFAEARKDGQPQQKVMLPDGTEIGLVSIRGGSASVDFGGSDAFLGWCREHAPHAVEQYIVEGAAGMRDVVELVATFYPSLVKERVRSSSLAAFTKQAEETGGFLIDDEGEKHRVAEVTRCDPTGAFAYRPAKDAQDRIMAEWQAGNLREIALGPLALPAGGESGE